MVTKHDGHKIEVIVEIENPLFVKESFVLVD